MFQNLIEFIHRFFEFFEPVRNFLDSDFGYLFCCVFAAVVPFFLYYWNFTILWIIDMRLNGIDENDFYKR